MARYLKNQEIAAALQRLLVADGKHIGTSGPQHNGVDGHFDALSRQALHSYSPAERRHHLHQARQDAVAPHPPKADPQIEAEQQILHDRGYDLGTSGPHHNGVDGHVGPSTQHALDSLSPDDRFMLQGKAKLLQALRAQQAAQASLAPIAAPPPHVAASARLSRAAAPAAKTEPSARPTLKPGGKIPQDTAIVDYASNSVILSDGTQIPVVSGKIGIDKKTGQQVDARNKVGFQDRNNLGPAPVGGYDLGSPTDHNFHMADKSDPIEHRVGMSLSQKKGEKKHNRSSLVGHEAHGAGTNGCLGFSKEGMQQMANAYRNGLRHVVVMADASQFLGHPVPHKEMPHGTPHYHNGPAHGGATYAQQRQRTQPPGQRPPSAPNPFSLFTGG